MSRKEKLPLNVILAAIDTNSKSVWDEFTEEQRKCVPLFTLNRWISSVKGSREHQEHYLLLCNELYNKNLFDIMNKDPKLTWQTACACSHESKKVFFHEWIGLTRNTNKKVTFLSELFPEMKLDDVEALAEITTVDEIKQYCRDLGWDKKQISAIKF